MFLMKNKGIFGEKANISGHTPPFFAIMYPL